jgi:hypothetical protein
MSQLVCKCGHIIIDQTDFLPYKARYYSDEDSKAYDETIDIVADFMIAREEGRENDILMKSDAGDSERTKLSFAIARMFARYHIGFSHIMYECEQCGRLWIQPQPGENSFVSYLPETDTREVLRSHGRWEY